jgi:hypothetical protein
MPNQIASLDVLTTRFDPAEAEVSITVAPQHPAENLSLRGRLMGPRSPHVETIEIAYYLQPAPSSADLLRVRVVIPEANLWSPQTPFLYEGPVELWSGEERVDQQQVVHGLRHAVLGRKGLRLNGHPFHIHGVTANTLADEVAQRLRNAGCNLLVAKVGLESASVWEKAERLGFLVLGQLEGTDDDLLWYAEDHLCRRTSAFGWLLPQSLTREPQLWHNAMLHLQAGRRDVLFGVKLEDLPLGVLPGHVSFVACEEGFLPELRELTIPRLILGQRGDTSEPERSPRIIGKVFRDLQP